MILVYTGNGKGKTSACVGQAVRAYGQGMAVAFAQFMKRPGQAGEQKVLQSLLGGGFNAGGEGFFRKEEDRPRHREAALAVWRWAVEQAGRVDMLVLDEALYALGSGLLEEGELRAVMQAVRGREGHLVLSGRGLPDWLAAEADLVTEMREIKHPYAALGGPVRGIEF